MPKFTKIYQALNENRVFYRDYFEAEIPLTNFTQDLADDESLEYYPRGLSFLMIQVLYEKYLPNIKLNTTFNSKFLDELMNVPKGYFFIRKNNLSIQKKNKLFFRILDEEKRITLNELLILFLKEGILNKKYKFRDSYTILLDTLEHNTFIAVSFSPATQITSKNSLNGKTTILKRQIMISSVSSMQCTKHCGFLEKTTV